MEIFWDVIFQVILLLLLISLFGAIFFKTTIFLKIFGAIVFVILGFILAYSICETYFDINIFDSIKDWVESLI